MATFPGAGADSLGVRFMAAMIRKYVKVTGGGVQRAYGRH